MGTVQSAIRLAEGEFFGASVSSKRQHGIRYSETWYEPLQRVPAHSHQSALFCYLASGSYSEQYASRREDYEPGSIVFHPAGETHYGWFGDRRGRCLQVEVAADIVARLTEHGRIPGESVSWHRGPAAWLGRRLFGEFTAGRPASDLAMEGMALELLAHVVRYRDLDRGARWLRQVHERIRQALEEKLIITELASELDLEPVRMARAFRRRYGESIGRMHRRLRIEEACRRLVDPDVRVTDVAADLAFADQSHFTRIFRQFVGTTPARYRRSL